MNKKVCKACMNRDGRAPWNKEDEKEWKQGNIICPLSKGGKVFNDVSVEPPLHCPYILEHIISNRFKNNPQKTPFCANPDMYTKTNKFINKTP